MSASLHCFGALALEIAAPPLATTLAAAEGDELGAHVARDLQRLLPGVDALDLVLAAAHYDPAELLRPRWPLHATLAALATSAPRGGMARVIAIGTSDDVMPATLQPDPALLGGPLRLLPFALLGEASRVATIAQSMEQVLLETGMAGAATALHVQHAFGGRLEHARFLTLHDLCAMIALQYEHAGLAPLWPLIEGALLAPDAEQWLDAAPEPLLLYRGGEVRLADPDADAWRQAGLAPDAEADDARQARAFRAHGGRLRQFQAVLAAHAIPVKPVALHSGDDARARLAER